MIIALTGAKKNIGDFLIADRGIKLLRHYVDDDVVELDRFKSLDDQLEMVNQSRAVVLCGGPAYAENVYPGIYPLVEPLSRIQSPIVPFGLGWCGRPIDEPGEFSFTPEALEFLEGAHAKIESSSVRDSITLDILGRHGLGNVAMTGCPVWYDLRFIGTPFAGSRSIESIVFTTPDNPKMIPQVLKALRVVRDCFPDAKIVSSFHRGIASDRYTSQKAAMGYRAMVWGAKALGISSVDVAYDLDRINFYEDFDLHVGYRVHAHLHFLSRRSPSVLLCEDGRGVGMVGGLAMEPIRAWDPDVIDRLRDKLQTERSSGWRESAVAVDKIEETLPTMAGFLASIR